MALIAGACAGDAASTTSPIASSTTSSRSGPSSSEAAFESQPGDGTPVVVDYNPTSSDVTALLYILQQEGIRVDAITIPGTGESHCDHAVANTLGLLELLDKRGIPVACGSTDPIVGTNQWPAAWREVADELPGISLPTGGEPSPLSGPELLVAAVTQSDERVKLLTLGPLTNVAEALALDPSMVSNIDSITIMGGAVAVGGNVPVNGMAEWNMWIDPTGAQTVLDSGAPIVLVPLDATNGVPVDRAWYNQLSDNRWTPASNAVFDLFSANPAVLEGGFFFWDELAAAIMLDDSYATFETTTLSVVLDGIEEGRTESVADGVEVRVAMEADAPRFRLDLISGLNGGRSVEIVTVDVAPEIQTYFGEIEEIGRRVNADLEVWFSENEGETSAIFGGDLPPPAEAREVQKSFIRLIVEVLEVEARDLEAMNVPELVLEAHLDYLEASESFRERAIGVAGSIETMSAEDLVPLVESELGSALDELIAACSEWNEIARNQRLDVDLSCSG